ncbi:MAG TPA: thiamine pyrophosphate-binding protein, partial [Azospirillaceae bacterium]|nr:thiamine pyrophosphate-binding protein [Azospirillaceae bacterium]
MTGAVPRTGGRILVDALVAQGAELAFCVAGESYLDVLDAALDRPQLRLVTCRQEGGAAFMAEAYGKLTGRPGIVMVTRGPGACNAAIGVHTAMQDSTPMILLVGQIERGQAEREAFQEIDYRRMYGQMAKWVAQIDRVERIPEYVSRAFHTATAGRPGPVVLALPEDTLFSEAAVADAPKHHVVRGA